MSAEIGEKPDSVETTESAAVAKPVTPYYTIILIVCICAVMLVQFLTSSTAEFVSGERAARLAGFDKVHFLTGQYWRILTGAAIHGSVFHLLFNAFALFNLGRIFEMLAPRAHLAIVFLLSVIGGGVLSLIFLPDGVSVGASGGIIGFLGYLTVYALKRKAFVSSAFLKDMLINIALIIGMGVLLNYIGGRGGMPLIDNFGHIGGLLTGAVFGFLTIPSDPEKDPRVASSVAEITGTVALGVYLAVCVFTILLLKGIV